MMPSIRRFLLFNLLLSITITSSLTAVGTYFLDNTAIKSHLDSQLQQISHFIFVITQENPSHYRLKKIQNLLNKKPPPITPMQEISQSNQGMDTLQFQVWTSHKKLLLHSPYANSSIYLPSKKEGFSNQKIGKKTWRIYTRQTHKTHLTIAVAELYNFREALEKHITWDNLLILLWTYPLLGLLIWLTIGSGLSSLKRVARELSSRDATDFSPIDLQNVPIEIQPLVEELNKLLIRLQYDFESNKRFASDAAHELRTPLAALKTQAQVAQLAARPEDRSESLQTLTNGVDRCTHIVEQLLTLNRLSQEENIKFHDVDLIKITTEMIAQLAPYAVKKDVDIEFKSPTERMSIEGNETTLSILIRNLVDNAIRYTPDHGKIEIGINKIKDHITLYVMDNGPGIPEKARTLVFERFYRLLRTQAPGSGLGLAIVQQIAELHHASIELGTPPEGTGLKISIIFPIA